MADNNNDDVDECITCKRKAMEEKEIKTYVFNIELTDHDNRGYAEFSWKDWVQKEEDKERDIDTEISDIVNNHENEEKATVFSIGNGEFYMNSGGLEYKRGCANEYMSKVNREMLKISGEMVKINQDMLKTNKEMLKTDEEMLNTNNEIVQTNEEMFRTNETMLKTIEEILAEKETSLASSKYKSQLIVPAR